MGKRTSYPREPRDFYRTIDPRAVTPLLFHVKPGTRFVEPCAGAGDLVDQLVKAGMYCVMASDIKPQARDIACRDALKLTISGDATECFITNPMWRRDHLLELIPHLIGQYPAWLLLDAGFAQTKTFRKVEKACTDIVAAGRLKWFPDDDPRQKGHDPMDDCAWYRFGLDRFGAIRFWPRR